MKIRITVDLDRNTRRAIARRVRNGGRPATYAECRQLLLGLLAADVEVIVADYHADTSCENCGCHNHLPGPCETCGCNPGNDNS